jgi:hypothetical protein
MVVLKGLQGRWVTGFVSAGMILLLVISLPNQKYQSISWTYPYFSGAANLKKVGEWKISKSDFAVAEQIPKQRYPEYRHQTLPDLISHEANHYGYVLIAFCSRAITPFLGDLQGVAALQVFTHVGICVVLNLFGLRGPLERWAFLFLYAANPMILKIVTFPFYYFWLSIPSALFVLLVRRPEWSRWWVWLAVPALGISLWVRPTTIFLALFFFLVAWIRSGSLRQRAGVLIAALVLGMGLGALVKTSTGSAWHTMYVGIGAYPNNLGVMGLDDKQGFKFFAARTGIPVDTNPISGNWKDPDFRKFYNQVIKTRYLEILQESPWVLIRNAVLNTLQVFSFGYVVGQPLLNAISILAGILVIAFLIWSGQFVWAAAILSSAIGFCWYFPPIPAYNFAAYLLVIMGAISGAHYIQYSHRLGSKKGHAS